MSSRFTLDDLKNIDPFDVPASPGDDYNRVKSGVNAFVRGAGNVVSSLPKAVGELTTGIANKVTGGSDSADDSFGYEVGGIIDQYFAENFPTNDRYRGEFAAETFPSSAGSLAGFAASGLVSKALKIPAALGTATIGGAATGVEGVEDYKQTMQEQGLEVDPDKRFSTFAFNVPLGASEAIPLSKAFDRFDKLSGKALTSGLTRWQDRLAVKAAHVSGEGIKGGFEESLQEIFQKLGANYVASGLVEYDPERDLFQGTGEGGAAGFITGLLMNSISTGLGMKYGNGDKSPIVKSILTDAFDQKKKSEETGQPVQPMVDPVLLKPSDKKPNFNYGGRTLKDLISEHVNKISTPPIKGPAQLLAEARAKAANEGKDPLEQARAGAEALAGAMASFRSPVIPNPFNESRGAPTPDPLQQRTADTVFERETAPKTGEFIPANQPSTNTMPVRSFARGMPGAISQDIEGQVERPALTNQNIIYGEGPTVAGLLPSKIRKGLDGMPLVSNRSDGGEQNVRVGRDEKYGIDVTLEKQKDGFLLKTSDDNQEDIKFSSGAGGVYRNGFILNKEGEFVPPAQIVQAGLVKPQDENAPFKGSREELNLAIELAAELEFAKQTGNTELADQLEKELFDLASGRKNENQAKSNLKGEVAKLKAKQGAAERTARKGSQTKAWTPDNKEIDLQFEVVESSSLQKSNDNAGAVNKAYPAELQPRDRTSLQSRAQITEIAGKLNPNRLGDNPEVTNGAPIVDPDTLAVIAGNGRSLALDRAYSMGDKAGYKQWLVNNAAKFGINAEEVAKMKNPVLVRNLMTPMSTIEKVDMAGRANERTTLAMTPTETAQQDAQRITDEVLAEIKDGDLSLQANVPFIRKMAQSFGSTEAAGLMDTKGRANKQMIDRLTAAIVAKAYGSKGLTETVAEGVTEGRKNLVNALVELSSRFARLQRTGRYSAISGHISEAVDMLRDADSRGLSIDEYLAQQDSFTERSEAGQVLAVFFDQFKNSKPAIVEGLESVYSELQAADDYQSSGSDMFGDYTPPTVNQIVKRKLKDEIEAARARGRNGRSDTRGTGEGQPGRSQGRGAENGSNQAGQGSPQAEVGSPEDFGLSIYSEEDIAAKEKAQQDAADAEAARIKQEEDRAKADKARDDFTLTGSNQSADIAAAAGQEDIFSQPEVNENKKYTDIEPEDSGYDGNSRTVQAGRKGKRADNSAEAAQSDKSDTSVSAEPPTKQNARLGNSLKNASLEFETVSNIVERLNSQMPNAEVIAVATEKDLPQAIKDWAEEKDYMGKGSLDAVYHDGKAYVVAENSRSERQVVKSVLHEVIGHHGIHGVLGDRMDSVLDQIARDYGRDGLATKDGERITDIYGLKWSNPRDRRIAAEEYIAHLAETNSNPGLLDRIIAKVRELLRKIYPSLKWTDADIAGLLAKSRKFVEGGKAGRIGETQAGIAAQLKGDNGPGSPIYEAAKAKGLDMSKEARTERAKAMGFDIENIAYHATTADFSEFDTSYIGSNYGQDEDGFFFSSDPDVVSTMETPSANRRIDVFLTSNLQKIEVNENPSTWIDRQDKYGLYSEAKDEGFDGLAIKNKKNGEITYVVFNPSNIRSINAAFDPDQADSPDIRAKLSSQPRARLRKKTSAFEVPVENTKEDFIRKIADKFKILKDIQANIEKAGGTVDEQSNVYRAETLMHGKAENDLNEMRDTFVEPLAKKMAQYKIGQALLDEYLRAKHAKERNAHIAKINPAMPDGGSGMTNKQAQDILDSVAQSGQQAQFDELADIVYAMLKTKRDMIRQYGLEDDDVVDAWEASYKHYVPLKGFAEDEKQEGLPRTGKGFSVGGSESKRATGRSSESASPLSYAIQDLTETMLRKRKNDVGNTLLNLVEANPEANYWEVFTNDNPEKQRRVVKRVDPATGQKVDVVEWVNIPMAMMQDRYFTTKRDGQTYYIRLDDQRLMKAMKNLGPDTSNFLIQGLSKVSRFLASVNTSYNPEFLVSNFARDIQTAILNINAEQSRDDGKARGLAIAKQTVKDVPKAMKAAYRGLRNSATNKLSAADKEWLDWFDEFKRAGAKTGYYDMKDIDGQAKDIQRLVDMANGGFKGNFYKWSSAAMRFVDDANGAVENAVRLSAYVNARKAGVSQDKAADLAKNMTVNFNRRGEVGTTLNAVYMFANASIQGTANFVRTMGSLNGKKGDKLWSRLNMAQKIAVGMMAGAYGLAILNRMGADDDDDGENFYDKIPQYVKERNIVIMKSLFGGASDEYWKIPLPYGYNIFHNIGTSLEAVTVGGKPVMENATNLALATLGSFSPIGFQESQTGEGLILKNLAPTIMKPVVELALNENFAGQSIYSENFPFGTPKPDSSLGRRTTPAAYKEIAEFLNDVSGGSQWRSGAIDINPDVMRYLVDYATGGAGAFALSKVPDNFYNMAVDVDNDWSRVAFVSKVAGKVTPYADQEKFYQRRDEINQIITESKELRGRDRIEFIRDNRKKMALGSLIKSTETKLKLLRRNRDSVYNSDLSPKAKDLKLKEIEARMKAVVDQFNAAYAKAS